MFEASLSRNDSNTVNGVYFSPKLCSPHHLREVT